MTYPEAIKFLYGLRWIGAKLGLLMVFCALAFWLHKQATDPVIRGERVRAWVRESCEFSERGKQAAAVVREIGPAAIPFLVAHLGNPSHHASLRATEWLRVRLPLALRWASLEPCQGLHLGAANVLATMGVAARPAAPAMIRCLEDCRSFHYGDTRCFLESMVRLGPVAPEVAPFLRRFLASDRGEAVFDEATIKAALAGTDEALITILLRDLQDSHPRADTADDAASNEKPTNPDDIKMIAP